MGLFDELFSNKNEEEERRKQLIEECKKYDLEEWQIELVLKGEYDLWDFEEDGELEEDDYYYEDDGNNHSVFGGNEEEEDDDDEWV